MNLLTQEIIYITFKIYIGEWNRMNRVNVVGRIVRDITLKDVGNGKVVMNNAIAIPKIVKKDGGPEADFLNFVVWGKRAELMEEYCSKGDLIGLDGKIQSRRYLNEKENTVYVVELLVESVHFLQTKRNNNATNSQENTQSIQTANGEQNLQIMHE